MKCDPYRFDDLNTTRTEFRGARLQTASVDWGAPSSADKLCYEPLRAPHSAITRSIAVIYSVDSSREANLRGCRIQGLSTYGNEMLARAYL